MTVSNLYNAPGAASRGGPALVKSGQRPFVLTDSARLLDDHRRRVAEQGGLQRSGSAAAPLLRTPDRHPLPIEDQEPRAEDGPETLHRQTDTTVDERAPDHQLPVRWTPVPGCLILVARARGGIGATSLAVNLALEMRRKCVSGQSRERRKVALVDFDVQFGTVASSLDLVDRGGLLKLLQLPRHPDAQAVRGALITHDSGLRVLAAPANPIPLDALDVPRVAAIIDALMADNDVVIIDMPPALVRWIEPLLSRATRLLMVTNLAVTSVTSARRMLDVIREDAPDLVVEAVVSRDHKPILRNKLVRQAEDAIGAPLSYWLPDNARDARLALDRGEPMTTLSPRSAWSRAVRGIAQSLDHATPQKERQR